MAGKPAKYKTTWRIPRNNKNKINMACTFDYKSGKATFDFSLKKVGGVCMRNDIPRRIGNLSCKKCKSYIGERKDFVLCKYHKEDDEGSFLVKRELREELRLQALIALCD